jgi:hypothetical protein
MLVPCPFHKPFQIGATGVALWAVRCYSTGVPQPLAPGHQVAVLWGGWLLNGMVFFSSADYFHEYYITQCDGYTAWNDDKV